MRYFISADIGTQGTKAAVVDDTGRIVSSAFRPSRLIRGQDGRIEQEPEEMFASTVDAIAEAVSKPQVPKGRIAAIGLDGQMAGILGIDREWRAVTPYDSWLDSRCSSVMGDMKAWGEERFIALTGCPVTNAHGPKQLWWKRERPDVYRKIAKFVVPAVYIAGRLAGLRAEQAFIDDTYLHFTGFADTGQGIWSDELMRAFGMDIEKLPSIVRPWDVIGYLQPEHAEAAALPPGIPIVAGCGDTAACALGAGLTEPGRLLDIAGTASVLAGCTDHYKPDTQTRTLMYARSVIPGLYMPLAYINGGGECIAWFGKLVGSRSGAALTYDELNREAGRIAPGSDGLLFIPHFGGRVCPSDSQLRGGWIGMHWGHGEAAMYRSILESIAYEYAGYLWIHKHAVGQFAFSQVHAVGGGASSALFNQIKADVLGLPYRTLQNQETALTANALIAGYGIGTVPSLAEAAAGQAKPEQMYDPDHSKRGTYARYAAAYQQAVSSLSELYQQRLLQHG
ncbi:FGGY-family carbohydrate kinase [Paenibacillus lactis]|uniref:FGGY-family carbohydrate kinase n=1 Tax=Paenibacillus lactis TaxID=228574 RepID=UPI001B159248|nr:FGGY family carbohydrate kinase [Paenibacillus lactis]GIO89948.1 gluconate kinase [Paenibacillus lactis]